METLILVAAMAPILVILADKISTAIFGGRPPPSMRHSSLKPREALVSGFYLAWCRALSV